MAQQRHDTLEVKAILGLTNEFLRKDIAQARNYAQQAIRTSSQIQYAYGLCSGYVYLTSLSQSALKRDSALYYLGLIDQLAKEHPEDIRISKNYNQTAGLFYKAQGEFKRALPYFLENLKLATKEDENKAGSLLNIGNTYSQMADHRNAMTYHLQSLSIFEKIGNKRGQSFCLHSLATDYYFLKQLDKAEEYLERSLKLKNELQDKRGMVTALQALGNIAKDRNQYVVADQYYNKSLVLAREMKAVGDEIVTLHQMGMNHMRKPDPVAARKVFTEGLTLARQLGDSTLAARLKSSLLSMDVEEQKKEKAESTFKNNLNTMIVSGDKSGLALEYGRLSEYYALNHDYEKAFEYLKKHEALNDSLEGNAVLIQMKTLEEQFKNDQKEKEIQLLKKDQELHKAEISRQRANISIIVVVLISVIVIGILLINRYRVLNRTRRLVELERMRNTIARDLHDDIGSTLSSINIISQMALKDATGNALNFQRIAQHSSSMMESMSDIVWSINPNNDSPERVLSKMKEFAAEILDPLDITYTFTGEENLQALKLDAPTRKSLFLIFKEAINNAAKYSSATAISIEFRKLTENLQVVIRDNGKGFDLQAASTGNGVRNMKERAISLKGNLDLRSEAGNGTTITLSIPLT